MVDNDALLNLEKLHQLKNEGVISEAEFEKSKERLLFGSGRTKVAAIPSPVGNPALDDHFGWMLLPLKRYVQFTGRASRKEFWMFQIVYVALIIVTVTIAGLDQDEYGQSGAIGRMAFIWLIFGLLGLAVPLIAVEVRRFHDQDRSGWFALLNFIPYVGPLIVLAMMLIDGTPGDNRFGPNPKSA